MKDAKLHAPLKWGQVNVLREMKQMLQMALGGQRSPMHMMVPAICTDTEFHGRFAEHFCSFGLLVGRCASLAGQ